MAQADRIANWIREQVERAGVRDVVVGMSGGVDSACVAGLAQRAVGTEHVVGVLMPCHSDPVDAEYAGLALDAFGLEGISVDLTPVFDSLMAILPDSDRRLAQANVKPRLRMTTLYYIANTRDGLVAGTGNKSELMVGYFTKYGDGGADILPLGDLYKREVYAVARQLGVPQEIIDRPPTAGLWPGQTDEEEMGLSYDELERALITLTIGGDHGVAPATLEKVRQMTRASEHKRELAPIFTQGSR
jgi:NAD+ synthase